MQWYLNPSLHIYKNLSSEHLSSELTLALQYTTDLNLMQYNNYTRICEQRANE